MNKRTHSSAILTSQARLRRPRNDAVRALRFIAPVERMEIVIGLLRHVVFVRDSMDRKRSLVLIAETVIELSLRTLSRHSALLASWTEPTRAPACPTPEFRLLMNVDYVRNLWNGTPDPAMRADLCGAFCAAMLEVVPADVGSDESLAGRVTPWVAVAMLVVETCSASLAWAFEADAMSFHVDAFLRLFAHLAHRFRESDTSTPEGMASQINSAISVSATVGAPKLRPFSTVVCTANTTSGSAWPRIIGPHDPT